MPTLEQKIRLLTGEASFTTYAIEGIGVQSIVLSDGPIGIRGTVEPSPVAAQLPNPSAVAALWDLELVGRLGTLIAQEARRLGVDVVLAPVVNLQRTPVGGRHFETYSEDPLLTGRTMVAFVTAVQAEGVAVCVKHFVGNDSETERTSYIARIDERTLREVYLAPFELAATEANAWSIMAAYNQVEAGGQIAQATDHGYLINDILKGEWGYDGVVISDWLATKTTVESALGGLDLVMPGPGGPWEGHLVEAVRAGLVPEAVIDDKVARILRLAERVGKLDKPDATNVAAPIRANPLLPAAEAIPAVAPAAVDPELPTAAATRALLRESVARSTVVLQNRDGALPLRPAALKKIAVIGPNAVDPFIQGGGSAFVNAPYTSWPVDAIREAFPAAEVSVERGGSGRRFAPLIDPALVRTASGERGYALQLLDHNGTPFGEPAVVDASEGWNRGIPAGAYSAVVRAQVLLDTPGVHRVELGLAGIHKAWFDGELVGQSSAFADSNIILNSSANHPDGPARLYTVLPGERKLVEIKVEAQVVDAGAYSRFVRVELRHDPASVDAETEIVAAVAAAAEADVAIVVVGTNEEVESEGWDRQSLALPQRQNELVARVLAANPNTIVVVNAGAPVILPWIDDVAAALWWWLPGQEAGHGLTDALTGAIEPSGRLPWTLPAADADVPVPNGLPVHDGEGAGVVEYTEGVDVGYRSWDRLGRTPARPFGFGLGYARFELGAVRTGAFDGETLAVSVEVVGAGPRGGRAVVQLYVSGPDAADAARPVKWFAGYASVEVAAGGRVTATIQVPRRAFEIWDVASHAWVLPAGSYTLSAAQNARDERAVTTVVAL